MLADVAILADIHDQAFFLAIAVDLNELPRRLAGGSLNPVVKPHSSSSG
jgi:hypothetical protein